MMRIVLLYWFILSPFFVQCRENGKTKTKLTEGYYGETLTHPGMVFGLEHYVYGNDRYQMILSANVGGYEHPRNNTSLFVRGQWGQRVTFKSSFFVDQFIGLGYLHHFASGGKIYDVLPNGAIVEIANNGRSMIMPSVALGGGYDLAKQTGLNLMIYVRPELFWKAPFNGYYLTHFALNVGLIFKMNGL
jgi:hypothetical protein